jgi:hypothetical protein
MEKPPFQFGLKTIFAATTAAAILAAIGHYLPLMMILAFAVDALFVIVVPMLMFMVMSMPFFCISLVIRRSWQVSSRRTPKD